MWELPRHRFLEPARELWNTLIATGSERRRVFPPDLAAIAASGRDELLRASRAFEEELTNVARIRGLSYSACREPQDTSGMVSSGHQPVIPHWGLMEKLAQLDSLGREGTAAFNIIIDLDEASRVDLVVPTSHTAELRRAEYTMTTGGTLFSSRRIASETALHRLGDEIRGGLRELPHQEIFTAFERAWEKVVALHEVPQSVAIPLLIDSYLPKRHFYWAPLSSLLRGEAFQLLVTLITTDPEALFRAYNSALAQYRAVREISNKANPFPDLASSDAWCELPLWAFRPGEGSATDSRKPVGWHFAHHTMGTIDQSGFCTLPSDYVLAPRGALVSFFLRLCTGDLFIHGRGGARYDGAMEDIAAAWKGVVLPPYVVASADAVLFPSEVRELDFRREMHVRIRRATTHPREVLEEPWLTLDARSRLAELATEREQLIAEQTRRQARKEPAGEIGQALSRLSGEIRSMLQDSLPSHSPRGPIDETVVRARDYPFFLFL